MKRETPHAEPLRPLDEFFLDVEADHSGMVIGGLEFYGPGPAERSLEIERIRGRIASKLHTVPRLRQRVERSWYRPSVWIDDPHFRIEHHVHHVALPGADEGESLNELVGVLLSLPLDRRRSPWEMWFIEGFRDGSFALLCKAHHCMIDGIAGVEILRVLFEAEPLREIEDPPDWTPRPRPLERALLRQELDRRRSLLGASTQEALRLACQPRAAADRIATWSGLAQTMLEPFLDRPAPGPFNGPIGSQRTMDWASIEMSEVKKIKRALSVTFNDVILSVVVEAVALYGETNELSIPDELRILVPINVRVRGEEGDLGNRITLAIATLPTDVADPVSRAREIHRIMNELKQSASMEFGWAIDAIGGWVGSSLLSRTIRAFHDHDAYHLIVSSLPGPPMPLFLLESEMLRHHPIVALNPNVGLSIGVMSYAGRVYWGLNADPDRVADLAALRRSIDLAFRELCKQTSKMEGSDKSPATHRG